MKTRPIWAALPRIAFILVSTPPGLIYFLVYQIIISKTIFYFYVIKLFTIYSIRFVGRAVTHTLHLFKIEKGPLFCLKLGQNSPLFVRKWAKSEYLIRGLGAKGPDFWSEKLLPFKILTTGLMILINNDHEHL